MSVGTTLMLGLQKVIEVSKVDSTAYDEHFWATHGEFVLQSARVVVPLVMTLVGPKSVVDVGCGVGA
jgi:hypothetical protein